MARLSGAWPSYVKTLSVTSMLGQQHPVPQLSHLTESTLLPGKPCNHLPPSSRSFREELKQHFEDDLDLAAIGLTQCSRPDSTVDRNHPEE